MDGVRLNMIIIGDVHAMLPEYKERYYNINIDCGKLDLDSL